MKSTRGAAMSQKMRQIKIQNPSMPQTQVLSMASKQLSGKNMQMMSPNSKEGGFLPLLLSGLAGFLLPKLLGGLTGSGMPTKKGKGLYMTPSTGSGMYLKPYR